jgi:hypothetical protein
VSIKTNERVAGLVLNAGDVTIKESDLNVENFQKKTLHDIFTSAITAKP